MAESPSPPISPPRRTRRASHNLTVRLQTMATKDLAVSIRLLADLSEISDGQVIRDALDAYVPDALKAQRKRLHNAKHRKAKSP